ncbi:MAG: HAD-IIB family hydrolase [Hyphomicrobiaceae bacterium]|nr:HAD-IIB family hydrolase [Hyphomicrobiaceae bacterium]
MTPEPHPRPDALVFTDLDGTLLDHTTYSFEAARPALERLRQSGIPLVLATSKTAAEVAPLHERLGLGATPAIVENGAGLYDPAAPETGGDAAYQEIRSALAALPRDLRAGFQGFGDLEAHDVATLTGLSEEAARLACKRCHSEPGLWSGTEDGKRRFLEALLGHGLSARQGGRFLTLSHGSSKADAMASLVRRFRPRLTLALGDAPNDVEMLEAADCGVIVRNDHAPPLPLLKGEDTGRITRTDRPGPEGWNDAVLAFIDRISAR